MRSFLQDYVALIHSLLAITVPFVMFSSYATPYEFEYAHSLAQPTMIFASSSLLPLALNSGLPAAQIYLLEGETKNHTSYDQLISSVRKNSISRLPVRHATKDTLAYMIFSSGTSGLPKGMYLFFPSHRFTQRNMDVSSTQHFSLHYYTAVMISHGNITHAILGMMVYGIEIGKVKAVCLSGATFWAYLIPLPATGMEHP